MKKHNTILIVMAHTANAQLLQQFLQTRYHLLTRTTAELTSLNKAWDLCIIDGFSLTQAQAWFLQHKQLTEPCFFPVLLVTSKVIVGRLPSIIDDVLTLPTSSSEMVTHIENLLKIRRLIQKNQALYLGLQRTNWRLAQEKTIRERFVTTLTHDLRSPLTATKLFAKLITQSANAQQQPLLQQANKTLDRMEALVQNLLDANHISTGEGIPLQYATCELNKILAQVVAELTVIYGPRFILQTEAMFEGYWDAKALQRVIENLCSNAIKYGDAQAPITLKLSLEKKFAVLTIHNEGKVLSKKEQQRLFKPYYRTASAHKSVQPGYGLGLTIVKGIIEAHGGTVHVTSTAKTGTTFTLHLPLALPSIKESC